MKIEEQIKGIIKKAVTDLGSPDVDISLEHPAEESHGDFSSNIAMAMFAKHQAPSTKSQTNSNDQALNPKQTPYQNPRQLAEAIVQLVRSDLTSREGVILIDKIEVAGPGFINFYLSNDFLVKQLEQVVKGGGLEPYSEASDKRAGLPAGRQVLPEAVRKVSSEVGEKAGKPLIFSKWQGKKVVVEHTSPNPNKAMHLGHLRNNITGMAIANLLEAVGAEVIRDCIDNNRGIAIAKLMWGFLKFAHKQGREDLDLKYWLQHQEEWQTSESAGKRPDRFMDDLYVKGADDFKANKEVENTVRQMVVDWENEDEATWALWRRVLEYVYEGQKMTLDRLGNKWDNVWHEHEHYKKGKELVEAGLQKGILRQLPDGAVITNLEKEFGLTDTVVRKADGTSLYITQDLALTKLKKDKFGADYLYWVIGPEQALAMKQMFAVCSQLGIGKYEEFVHLAYGYMSIKGQGKMSSRLGNVVYIDDLLDMAKAKAAEVMKDRGWEREELEKVAEEIGVGAVKYSILKVGRLRDMDFDLEESVSLEGNSGPYIQYTYARTQSVLRKSKVKGQRSKLQVKGQNLNAEELSVLRWLYRFPEFVEQAANTYSPHLIATYLYELAQRYNGFYNKHTILGGADSGEAPIAKFQSPNNNRKISNESQNTKQETALSSSSTGPDVIAAIGDPEPSQNPATLSSYSSSEPASLEHLPAGRQVGDPGVCHPVLVSGSSSSAPDTRSFRVSLTTATGIILKQGLNLLGINAPEKM